MKNLAFKVGDKIIHRMEMFESMLSHQGTILRMFKNGKVRITFKTWTGAVNTINVEAETLTQVSK